VKVVPRLQLQLPARKQNHCVDTRSHLGIFCIVFLWPTYRTLRTVARTARTVHIINSSVTLSINTHDRVVSFRY